MWLSVVALLVSAGALLVSILVGYKGTLQPFMLRFWLSPVVQLQHKGNLGLYIDFTVQNPSPASGIINEMVLVVHRLETPQDRYLLQCIGFMASDERGIAWTLSEEQLPIFMGPGQSAFRTANFLYTNEEHFPIATGVYVAELLVWTDYEPRARYAPTCEFQVSADMLAKYQEWRMKGLTRLQKVPIVGARHLECRKISEAEYRELRQR